MWDLLYCHTAEKTLWGTCCGLHHGMFNTSKALDPLMEAIKEDALNHAVQKFCA